MPTIESCDVLVIGGGPAGSTTASFLAGRAYDVTGELEEMQRRFVPTLAEHDRRRAELGI